VRLVTLPAENWRWRMRGGAVRLADMVGELCAGGYRPDVVIVSDMIDLALFRELTQRHWGRPHTVLYMHENQLAYPSQKGTAVDFPWLNWSSALVADEIWFNSRHHLDIFFELLPALFDRFPDGPHDRPVADVRKKAVVMPVGVELAPFSPSERSGTARIVWNHRWEHDKRPDRFMRAVRSLEGLDFEVVLCGEEPLGGDPARDAFVAALGDRLVWNGFADRDAYVELLNGSDISVSTADHEFFGVSIVEAVAAGCCPVLPARLSYPELIAPAFHDAVFYVGSDASAALRERVTAIETTRVLGRMLASEMAVHAWEDIAPSYDSRLEDSIRR
jgi:glycosyltransferase involved in cell wall biosynthesis